MASDLFSPFGTASESPPDDRDYSIRPFLDFDGRATTTALPDEVGTINADLHRKRVGITDQGFEGSCTGHAYRNVRMVNEMRHRRPWLRRRVPEIGPRGIYHLAKTEGGYPEEEGAYMRDVVSAAKKFGSPREKDWPYVPHTNAKTWKPQDIGDPKPRWLQYARPWGIGVYARVRTLEEMLFTLQQVGPLFIAMDLTESFMEPGPDGVIPLPSGDYLGGHAMAFLMAVQSRRQFLCANSWGEPWGAGGYCWVDFDHFLTRARSEAWAIPDM